MQWCVIVATLGAEPLAWIRFPIRIHFIRSVHITSDTLVAPRIEIVTCDQKARATRFTCPRIRFPKPSFAREIAPIHVIAAV